MDNSKAYTTIGVLGTLLILMAGTFILNPTGKELRCSTGWEFQEEGGYAGQYKCETTTTLRYVYCSKTWDTKTGRKNYYCQEAVPILIEPEEEISDKKISDKEYNVANNKKYKCSVDGCEEI